LHGLIYQLGIFGFFDPIAIDNQRPPIGSDGFRRRRVSFLKHFRPHNFAVNLGPGGNSRVGQFELSGRFIGANESAVDRHAIQVTLPRSDPTDLVAENECVTTTVPFFKRTVLEV
jgi:hypothetical protein